MAMMAIRELGVAIRPYPIQCGLETKFSEVEFCSIRGHILVRFLNLVGQMNSWVLHFLV